MNFIVRKSQSSFKVIFAETGFFVLGRMGKVRRKCGAGKGNEDAFEGKLTKFGKIICGR